MRIVMNKRIAFLSAVAVMPLMFAAAEAAAALGEDPPALSSVAGAAPRAWLVRAEGSLVGMRDSWLGLPEPEVGLTVGRDLGYGFSLELTGNAREVASAQRRSWSVLAAARQVIIANATGRHALTAAAGPFLEIGNAVHGTVPFAHLELAYVYRAPFGLTVLAGFGPNIALASSSYVAPPPASCSNDGDAIVLFCGGLGPDAQEIHAGDMIGMMRLAVGWQF
jgi:hypothetical protein